jgi:hypothetical protein
MIETQIHDDLLEVEIIEQGWRGGSGQGDRKRAQIRIAVKRGDRVIYQLQLDRWGTESIPVEMRRIGSG